jgi:hypothetical protein
VQFDDLLLKKAHLQRAKPSGAGEGERDQFCFCYAVEIRGRAELGLYLRLNTASNPSSTNWRLVRSIVAMLVSSAAAIRLSLQPSPSPDTSAFSRMRAFVSSRAERLPLWIYSWSWARSSALNRTTVLLDGNVFPDQESPPSLPCDDRDSEVAVIFNDGSD